MKANEDPDDYLTRLDNYRNKMKRAPFHHNIRDQDFFIHVLNTLPKEYESVVEALERKLGKGTLTMTKVKSELRSKYARVKIGKKANKDDMILFTREVNNNRRFKNSSKETVEFVENKATKQQTVGETPKTKIVKKNPSETQ